MTLKQQQKQLHRLFRIFLSLRKKACAIPNINARETSDRDFISLIFCNIPRPENFFDCRALCATAGIDLSRPAALHLKYMTALLNPDLQKLPDF